ncbi:LOW QUALITY PROTEIN: Helitron helicase [Phytophthora megakarya]|uniref:Helitron helicase n=1 Tax=Phytophthora megakarya TaxID=4795 RepID=A0A225X033_9STRA|nr:LOW QUALITY PROTEIN: Helitron helicase [Phytophthora megakarya]
MSVQISRNSQTAVEVGAFADYLLQVRDQRYFISPTLSPDFIKVPEDMLLAVSSLPQSNIEEQARHRLLHLVKTIYADLNSGNHPEDNVADITILMPKTTDVIAISKLILKRSLEKFSNSCRVDGDDELQRQEHGDLYPLEFLNNISLSGMPPHKLNLIVGTPVMLIRNLNTKEGLCNGARLRIVQLRPNCMASALMSGDFAGI